jgi:hypothetical protein
MSGQPKPLQYNFPAAKHAEGKAAIWIRENNSSGGVLFHNNPGGTCGFCNRQIETLLPDSATLRVVPPAKAISANTRAQSKITDYIGNTKIPKRAD